MYSDGLAGELAASIYFFRIFWTKTVVRGMPTLQPLALTATTQGTYVQPHVLRATTCLPLVQPHGQTPPKGLGSNSIFWAFVFDLRA